MYDIFLDYKFDIDDAVKKSIKKKYGCNIKRMNVPGLEKYYVSKDNRVFNREGDIINTNNHNEYVLFNNESKRYIYKNKESINLFTFYNVFKLIYSTIDDIGKNEDLQGYGSWKDTI